MKIELDTLFIQWYVIMCQIQFIIGFEHIFLTKGS